MLAPWVNRFYRLGRFALSGGLFSDNPAAAWGQASNLPDLIRTTLDQQVLELVIFFTIRVDFLPNRSKENPSSQDVDTQSAGSVGRRYQWLCDCLLSISYLLNVTQTTIVLPSQELRTTLTAKDNIALGIVRLCCGNDCVWIVQCAWFEEKVRTGG